MTQNTRRPGRCRSSMISCVGLVASSQLCACTGPEPEAVVRFDSCQLSQMALTSGAPRAMYLGLSSSEQAAVVALVTEVDGIRNVCSGVAVSPERVLTAAHCIGDREPVQITVGPSISCPVVQLKGTLLARHPSADLVVLSVTGLTTELATPLPPAFDLDVTAWLGELVQLAGYGVDDGAPPDRKLFLAEPITEVRTSEIEVNGDGRSGGCLGDSGGPLLIRGPSGTPAVVGILTDGSASCRSRDVYARLDTIHEWLQQWVGPSDVSTECGSIGTSGRCFRSVAVRCTNGVLHAERCSSTQLCAWHEQGFYACRDAGAPSSCGELTQIGQCNGSVARTCDGGVIEEEDCSEVGGSCIHSRTTGIATCAIASIEGST